MARAESHKTKAKTPAKQAAGGTQTCPTCGKSVVPVDGYCPECGSPMQLPGGNGGTSSASAAQPATTTAGPSKCPVCGTAISPGTEFCPNCGASIQAATGHVGAGTAAAPTTTPTAPVDTTCSVCGAKIPAGEEFCPNCGAPAGLSAGAATAKASPPTAQVTTCPRCGSPLKSGAKFCRECGYRLAEPAGQAAQSARAEPAGSGLTVGQMLAGRYKLVEAVGGGGMGTVYKGLDTHLTTRQEPQGREVAVKAIINTSDPELLAAAVEEREMLIRLDHPNIVRIYDIVEQGGIPYIVMAFVEGTSWKAMYDQNNGPLPESEAIRLLMGIRGAFEYLHGRTPPVVYRDFKPGQVIQVDMGNGQTRQVLIDLGTAMEYIKGEKREAWGTQGFAPPEIGGICEQPPSMDLFGIVSTLAALLGVVVDKVPVGAPPRSSWPVSEEIYDFVVRGRNPDPALRFATVDELFDQLEGVNRFIKGRERYQPVGNGQLALHTTRTLSQELVPVQSNLFTGKLLNAATGKIGALPALSETDPASRLLGPAHDLMTEGRYSEALVQINAALKTYPSSVDGQLLKAAALTNLGQANEAGQALAQANRLTTPDNRWRTLLVQAQAAESARDYGTAERLYTELIKLVPGEVLPRQALADLYRETGRFAPAAEMYDRVVSADPANADAVLGWADSLVALGNTDQAIGVLDAVNENALRYVDAQLRLIDLYMLRIDSHLNSRDARQNLQALGQDLTLAGRAIAGLSDRTESRHFYRLQADWWYAAYRMSKMHGLPPDVEWPDGQKHDPNNPGAIGRVCREAYRRYLQRAPDAPDREDVLARVYFDIDEWQ